MQVRGRIRARTGRSEGTRSASGPEPATARARQLALRPFCGPPVADRIRGADHGRPPGRPRGRQAALARGSFELGAGRPAAALAHFSRITDPTVAFLSALDRIEAATLAESTDLALDWLQPLQQFAASTDLAWAAARVHYCRALLVDTDSAEPLFEESLTRASAAERPFERARMELAYGSSLRRRRRRVDAREHLRAALEVFHSLGATPWEERARAELRATGQFARRGPSQTHQLTPQEVQVARLVADGLPTRDVAAHLFLSPRTIDFHLHNIFTKTGITSRTELAHLPLD